jgi:hypothetical protein
MMAKDRASIFDTGDTGLLDVSSFKPKTAANTDAVPVAHLRAIAEASQFPSREPPKSGPPRRAPRLHRTGRTMQFNCRATRETEALYVIADRQHWKVSETLEHALAALRRELGQAAGQG